MPFEYILNDLLVRNEQAVGALFLDESGEAVDVACADLTPYQLRIVGAYLGIYLRQLHKLTEATGLGEPEMLHISKDELHIYAVPLREGYCLSLIQRSPSLVASARRSLENARRLMHEELFPD